MGCGASLPDAADFLVEHSESKEYTDEMCASLGPSLFLLRASDILGSRLHSQRLCLVTPYAKQLLYGLRLQPYLSIQAAYCILIGGRYATWPLRTWW